MTADKRNQRRYSLVVCIWVCYEPGIRWIRSKTKEPLNLIEKNTHIPKHKGRKRKHKDE